MAASADLGGLGAALGPPVVFAWSPGNLLYPLLPWLAAGLLLLAPRNRDPRAWSIWLPMLAVAGLAWATGSAFNFLPSEASDLIWQALTSLGLAFVMAWLWAPRLSGRPRWLTFLALLASMGLIGFVTLVSSLLNGDEESSFFFLIPFAVGGLIAASAFALAARCTRRACQPLRFSIWLLAWLLVGWLVVATPFAVMAGETDANACLEVLGVCLAMSLATFLVCLPFLLLSFGLPYYRLRFEAWLWPAHQP